MHQFFLLLALAFGYAFVSQARVYKRALADIPNPMVDPLACGRIGVARSALCDPDKFITKDKQDEVEGYINAMTSVEIAVVVIKQMDLYSVNTVDIDLAAERYARGLHDRYGVGDKESQNGILVFLSVDDRAVFISTGKGVQEQLFFDMIQLIISNMKPELRRGDYGGALATCITNIDVVLSGKDETMIEKAFKHKIYHRKDASAPNTDEGSDTVAWILIGGFATFVGYLLWKGSQDRRNLDSYDRGRTKLETLLQEMEGSQDSRNKFEAKSCPICLEDFEGMAPNNAQANSLRCSLASSGSSNPTASQTPEDAAAATSTTTRSRTSSEAGDDIPVPPGTNIVQSKTVTLRCGHIFCIPCMQEYLKSERSNRCPICRKSLTGDDDHSTGAPPAAATTHRPLGSTESQPRLRRTNGSSPNVGSAGDRTSTGVGTRAGAGASTSSNFFSSFGRRTVHPYNYNDGSDMSSYSTQSNGGGTFVATETATSTPATAAAAHTEPAASAGASPAGQAPSHDHYYYDQNYHPYSSYSRRFNYFAPEWRFRLHRMHYMYPSVVDYEFLRIANGAINRGSMSDLRYHITERGAQVQRLATDLRHRMEQAARHSGSHGSSRSSFGGGRSSGGGGGRW